MSAMLPNWIQPTGDLEVVVLVISTLLLATLAFTRGRVPW